ncbi:MAG TPA: DUF1045 domain-containing protein [Devosiaceae bacterium]|jgi:putative phosphonate metabolism protein|nr:DUF1045 domain-containing protein [Devosiaceae bacterium]
MPERYGIYFAPAVTNPLWSLAAQWLGRDALTGEAIEAEAGGLSFAKRFPLTVSARRYGFHATLKAPMALDGKLEGKDLDRALKAYAAEQAPVDMGPIVLRAIGRFLALVPDVQSAALTEFAGRIVTDFDGFRAPMTEADREKRNGDGRLSARQVELVDRYGYPYVLEEFRLHMTLTDRLPPEEHEEVFAAASQWFAPVIGENLLLDRLVLFHEAEPGAPFTRLRDYPLMSA